MENGSPTERQSGVFHQYPGGRHSNANTSAAVGSITPADVEQYASLGLGKAFDITGQMDQPRPLTVLDFSHVDPAEGAMDVNNIRRDFGTYSDLTATGSSLEEYQREFTMGFKINDLPFCAFSASLGSVFNKNTTEESDYYYYRQQRRRVDCEVIIEQSTNPAILRKYLTKTAGKNINGALTPANVLKSYGTHVVTAIQVGTIADFTKSSKSNKYVSKNKFKITAESNFLKIYEANSSGGRDRETQSYSKETDEKFTFHGETGNVFIGFPEGQSLVPIYELAESKERRRELKEAYEAYLSNVKDSRFGKRFITEIRIIGGKGSSAKDIHLGPDYTKIYYDCNKGAGGAYIYILYKLTTLDEIKQKNLPVITHVDIDSSRKKAGATGGSTIPEDHCRVKGGDGKPFDLSWDAGGYFVYLTYKSEPYADVLSNAGAALTGLDVIGGKNWHSHEGQLKPGYKRIEHDINKGHGGEYSFVCTHYSPIRIEENSEILVETQTPKKVTPG